MRTLSLTVAPEDEGRLIGRVARGRMGVSARQLTRAKFSDLLLLDGESVHADHPVRAGQVVTVVIADGEPAFEARAEYEKVNVVYEDEDIFVIDKPAPLATQSSPKQPDNTLENRLAGYFHDPSFIFRPVNRLDKGTSGLMAAAKHAHAQMLLAKQLHTPDFAREYLAVTEGVPSPEKGRINLPIAKMNGATVRREVRPDGKPSATNYEVLVTNGNLTLVRLLLETGRTHQIRVHMAAVGCPVYGDFLYGTERPDELYERFALHSARMRFLHPLSGKEMTFSSPLPLELAGLVGKDYYLL